MKKYFYRSIDQHTVSVTAAVAYFRRIDAESKLSWDIDVGHMIDAKDCGSSGSVYSVKYLSISCIKTNLKDKYAYLTHRVFDLHQYLKVKEPT